MGGFGYILQEYDDPLPLSFNDVIEFVAELCLVWIETVFRLSMTGRSLVEGTMIQ
jgi:hypothetical protein